jgi:hypothetical protein
MKYLRILLDPIKLKGEIDDPETIQVDLYEKIQGMIDRDELSWSVDEDYEDDEEDF